MNKNAIKKFAIEARKKLIASVSDRAGMLGITPEGCGEPVTKGADFEVYKTIAGTEVTLSKSQCEQRRKLKEQIENRGFDAVVEEVAYTWFNRICAIRFMEINDYLPTRVRVLSSEKEGKNEPDIVTQAPDVDLDFTDKEREYILDCKMNNKLDELFKMLFIKQCNKLAEILPELFEATEDYTEMLLNISYTNNDDIIYMLVNQETGIPEADFNVSTMGEDGQPTGQVEIIGWLYQYYNTELKDDTFAQLKKNVKISKERIPAATQLFTPDWIVRYMVENSVGRLWIEHLRAVDPTVNEKETAEKFGWKYYLPESEQEDEVNVKLAEIRTSYKELKPEDITCIDPCMGSGHILVAMFDVLMDIYKSAGYSERDAAFEIVEHNIHGLDIDKRAYQLAYFAVMMKGRGYNRRFFKGKGNTIPQLKIHMVCESNDINRAHLTYFGVDLTNEEKQKATTQCMQLLDEFEDAKEYGSILLVDNYDWKLLDVFSSRYQIIEQVSFDTLGIDNTKERLRRLIQIGKILSEKYGAVVTNPPYMAVGNANEKLYNYVGHNYQDSKLDMFSVFIERCMMLSDKNCYTSMITMHAWMFLSSYEKLRNKIYNQTITMNLVHLGARGFDEIGGEIVQTVAYTLKKANVEGYASKCIRAVDAVGEKCKKEAFFLVDNYYISKKEVYVELPTSPLIYWLGDNISNIFKNGKMISEIAEPRQGLATADNEKFIRCWWEVNFSKIGFGFKNRSEAAVTEYKYFPYNKGGELRRWYGSNFFVVDWYHDGENIKADKLYKLSIGKCLESNSKPKNMQYYFRKGITWSLISTSRFGVRCFPEGMIFDVGSHCVFAPDELYNYIAAYLNSDLAEMLLNMLNPTMNFSSGVIGKLPIVIDKQNMQRISMCVERCVEIAKLDWNEKECSWDYKIDPLLKRAYPLLKERVVDYQKTCEERNDELCSIERELNEMINSAFGVTKRDISEVKEKGRIIEYADEKTLVVNFISYAVGCLFGRYSLDAEGIVSAGNQWNPEMYCEFIPDEDNIIPITSEEFLTDDIVERFCKWLSIALGEEFLEENLEYIASVLGYSEKTSKDAIRRYFINDFYKDHCSKFSATGAGKRPIYWLFESGKESGFKALVYIQRYDADLVGKIRVDYLHKVQKSIEQAMKSAEYTRDNATNGTEKSYATKKISKYVKQLAEIKLYDEAMAHIANRRIELDLDDGIKVNYAKFQGIEVTQEGKKTLKINLLAKI